LKPQLKSDDYGVMLSDRVLTAVVWTFGIFFALAIVVLFSPSTWPADLPPWIWIPMATVITIPIAKVFYSRIFRTLRRRKEQTKWILARL
jgi:branched-subunit amino acid ABC-type transport system permease component